ncbi:hypothetical protein NDU88_006892 [Pleurodeles waltl]|uniref:Uncharacterized protein n=1 Tax=Pleurodeles waltl TaxID=8319 RepID=A0AAV7TY58_PLEWA|nr:hypothetical protein NDU88_006892 [Pleurodeles waltl]
MGSVGQRCYSKARNYARCSATQSGQGKELLSRPRPIPCAQETYSSAPADQAEQSSTAICIGSTAKAGPSQVHLAVDRNPLQSAPRGVFAFPWETLLGDGELQPRGMMSHPGGKCNAVLSGGWGKSGRFSPVCNEKPRCRPTGITRSKGKKALQDRGPSAATATTSADVTTTTTTITSNAADGSAGQNHVLHFPDGASNGLC